MSPLTPDAFVATDLGRRPLLVQRDDRTYYKGVFSTKELQRQVRDCGLEWTADVDAARYADGVRTTHNGDGPTRVDDVWARYGEGCSIRLSWPQRHSDALWSMIVQLEELFGSGGGANAYLTPPGAQGFAPHYDDIDAFVVQVEGEKSWRLYGPRSDEEILPRYSSGNLDAATLGPLIAEVTLRAGELLYLPRGCVHQAVSGTEPSLHVTLSLGRQHAWCDLLEVGVGAALEMATASNVQWRETLPLDLADHMGVVHADDNEEVVEEEAAAAEAPLLPGGDGSSAARRAAITGRLRCMLRDLVDEMPLDAIVDHFLCHRYLHDRMPPRLAPADAARRPANPSDVTIDDRIRLLSRRVARLAVEEGVAALYYSAGNGRSLHAHGEPQHIDFALEAAPALEKVLTAYPKYVSVAALPADGDEQRLDIARALVEAGVVLVRSTKGEKGSGASK